MDDLLDPRFRLNHLYKIVTKSAQWEIFSENWVQSRINASTSKRKMILKSRQMGVTTNEVLKLFDFALFNRNVVALVMAHEDDSIKKIFRIPRRAYSKMNPYLKPALDRGGGSKYEMSFPKINSLIYCDLESRGDTIHKLHISEGAFIPHDRFVSTMQAVPLDGEVTIESTPNGIGNWFYELWHDKNEYEKFFFPWFLDAGYRISGKQIKKTHEENELIKHAITEYGHEITDDQIRWRRFKIHEIKDKFYQEYPEDPETCFLLSGRPVIDRKLISDLIKKAPKPIYFDDELKIFQERSSKYNYVVACDVSEGVGGDWSVATVYNIEHFEQAAILRVQNPPIMFAKKVLELCDKYTTGIKFPLLAIERNNHGHAVLLHVCEHAHYPNVYEYQEGRPGWLTDRVTRPLIVDQLIDAYANGRISTFDLDTLNELLTLVEHRGKIAAVDGKHDDCVMATAINLEMMIKYRSLISVYQNVAEDVLV